MRLQTSEAAYALRRLRRSPAFTIAATLTLAIAIGATASVFGVVDGVLLKAFPYQHPDRVLTLWESNPQANQAKAAVATGNLFDWQAQNSSFTTIAAACCGEFLRMTVTGTEDAERVIGLAVTPNYFAALGVAPILGRQMSADTSAPEEVVLSYGYWQRRFGAAPSVLGRTINVENPNDARPTRRHAYTIVGVMPPGVPGPVDLWVRIYFEPREATMRDGRYLDVYGRLKPGVTPEAAQRDLTMIAGRLASSYPKTNEGWTVRAIPLVDQLVGPVRTALTTLLAAAACVLLIGAANLANLFLVRCMAREREIALRTALGATRRRLVGELLTEAALLGLGAGVLAVGIVIAGVKALRALAPRTLPRLDQIGVDWRVLVFCAIASIATVLVFGLIPAWQVSRSSLASTLKEGNRGTGTVQRLRLQQSLVIAQVAIALVLLTGAGLLTESFIRFERMDPGFRPEGVLTAQIAFTAERYPTAERQALFLNSIVDQLAAQPGVTAAGVSGGVPGWAVRSGIPFRIVGDPVPDQSHAPTALFSAASPDYFRTMGIRLLRGRNFLPTDGQGSVRVTVIDSLLARRYFNGRDPLGRSLVFDLGTQIDTLQIVGVVTATKENGLAADDVPETYMAVAQLLGGRAVQAFISVRTSRDPQELVRTLTQTVARLDPAVPVSDVRTMSDRMGQSVGTTRFATVLASLFAVLAMVLGVVGVYSVLAYIVGQRQQEIAVRLALGAKPSAVVRRVLWQATRLSGLGIAVGMGAAWIVTRALQGLFLGVSPHDPRIFVGAPLIFAIAGFVAAVVPAMRTTRVSPAAALARG